MATQQQPCNLVIDYSEVQGDRILPFRIELNLQTSVLNPAPGQNQRFCYTVTGVGEGGPSEADLSHLVLGICSQIPASQIVNIFVSIDGVPQEITFGEGGNVELRTPANPDPTTGCPGLKFDFGLNKVGGVMIFCFELTTPYEVGPDPVCLKGGTTVAKGLSICGPFCATLQTCTATAYQPVSVCVPVTVTPFARIGATTTYCCGDPVVTPSATTCAGTVNGSCRFTITQNICVEIPVEFGATATTNPPSVRCGEASAELCPGCDTAAGTALCKSCAEAAKQEETSLKSDKETIHESAPAVSRSSKSKRSFF